MKSEPFVTKTLIALLLLASLGIGACSKCDVPTFGASACHNGPAAK